MATDVDRAYYGWPSEEMSDGDDPQEAAASQMVDHGSVSFGRFAVESLSWERRSVFTHNRRQEELEKFNGLVAKKRAYFEERYRKIRALKALKQNQQTELTLDYGADGSISSQTGEEEETASHHESAREQEANIAALRSEDDKVGTTFEQEISCQETLELVSTVFESTSPAVRHEISLSEESIGVTEHYESLDGDLHVKPIEIEPLLSFAGQVEMMRPELRGSVDNEERKVDDVEQKVENGAVNMEDPFRGTKDLGHSKMRLAKKPLYSKPASNAKGATSAVRNGRILDQRPTQNPSQASNGIKRPPQKIVGKGENNQITGSRRSVQQVNNNLRPALVHSNRLPAYSYPKINTPGLFTRVMERRVNNRASDGKLDASSSKKLPSTPSHASSGPNMKDMKMKRTTASGTISNSGIDSKRDVNNAIKKPSAAESKLATMRRNEAQMLGPTKPRMSSSLNLPTKNCATRKESQLSTTRVTKTKERKETIETRQAHGVTAKSFGSSMIGNIKIGTKMTTQARCNEQFHSGSKLRLNNLSLDGKKTRQEAQLHWR